MLSIVIFFFLLFFIVIQLQLSAFSKALLSSSIEEAPGLKEVNNLPKVTDLANDGDRIQTQLPPESSSLTTEVQAYLLHCILLSLPFTDVTFLMNWRQDPPPTKDWLYLMQVVGKQTYNIPEVCLYIYFNIILNSRSLEGRKNVYFCSNNTYDPLKLLEILKTTT